MYTIYGITSTFGKSYVSAQTLKYDLPNVYHIWYIIHLVNHMYTTLVRIIYITYPTVAQWFQYNKFDDFVQVFTH